MKCNGIGKRLRDTREQRGLSRRKVSIDAGVAPETVYSIERSDRMPGIDTVEKIATVLDVSAAWLSYGGEPVSRFLNFKPARGFDGLARAARLEATLQGTGGHLDQSYLYSDPLNAQRYLEIARNYRGLPLKEAAAAIEQRCQEPLSVVALGCGHARHETELVEHLVRNEPDPSSEPSIDFFLVDSSISLLSEGYRYASGYLARYDVPITAIEGDFAELPSFSDCFNAPRGPRRKVFTLIGYTIANLDNEISFLREGLLVATRGDLLLLDFCTTDSRIKEAKRVSEDPVSKLLASGATPRNNRHLAFLAGPVTRHFGDAVTLETKAVKDAGAISKSYSIECWVTVMTPDGPKRFNTASWRRYDSDELVGAFARQGWFLVGKWSFGPERPSLLALFQRGGR